MNVAQICRKALLDANVVKQDGTSPPLITDADLIMWANEAKDEIEKILRNAEADYLWVSRTSDDSSFDFDNELYDPSDFAFTTSSTRRELNLPPDFLMLKSIRNISSGNEEVQYRHIEHSSPVFQELLRSTNPQRDVIYFDIVGRRTLYIANPMLDSSAQEITYIRRSHKLVFWNTGTITTVQDDATVEGASNPNWLIEDLDNKGKLEIGFAASGSTAVSIGGATSPFVDVQLPAYGIASFTDGDTLEMDTAWRRSALSTVGYYIASVPQIAPEHHPWMAEYVKFKIEERLRNYQGMGVTQGNLDRQTAKVRSDIQERQNFEPEFVEDFEPWY